MFIVKTVIIFIIIELVLAQRANQPITRAKKPADPIKHNNDITAHLVDGVSPGTNLYHLFIDEGMKSGTEVTLVFNSDAAVEPVDKTEAKVRASPSHKDFVLVLNKSVDNLRLLIQGVPLGDVPYLTSMKILGGEYCIVPQKGYLDQYINNRRTEPPTTLTPIVQRPAQSTAIRPQAPETTSTNNSCGKRKLQHVELIVNGFPTKPGDWPWHAAIYRIERSRIEYICGGTLLSKFFVLTAAHCVVLRGVAVIPESRNVVLGKYNLVGGDIAPQEREVYQIIVHEGFIHSLLDNDIALLKLKSEAIFSDYVQPACMWHSDIGNKLSQDTMQGTVVGWGFDQTDYLSSKLQQVPNIPIVSDLKCIRSNPLFFSRILNEKKFCAGLNNGTSACNGDSGGGFMVFVPDDAGNISPSAPGSWHVKGIVSLSVSRSDLPICDPHQYVIFTDVAKYKDWLDNYLS